MVRGRSCRILGGNWQKWDLETSTNPPFQFAAHIFLSAVRRDDLPISLPPPPPPSPLPSTLSLNVLM